MKTSVLMLLPLVLLMLGGCTAVQDRDSLAAAPDAAAGAQQAAGQETQGTCSMRHSTLSCGGVPVIFADVDGRLSATVKIVNGWGEDITITDMVCTQGEEPAATTCQYGSVDTGNYTGQVIAPGSAYDGVLPCYISGTTDRATGRAGGQFSGTIVLWYHIVDGTDQPSRRDVMTIATAIR